MKNKLIATMVVCMLVSVVTPRTANSRPSVPVGGSGADGAFVLYVVSSATCYVIAYPVVFVVAPFSSQDVPGLGESLSDVSQACLLRDLKDADLVPDVNWQCPDVGKEDGVRKETFKRKDESRACRQ